MVNFGPLAAEIVSLVWCSPANFNGFRVLVATSLSGSQPNFARCLAVSWAGTLYIHFWGLLSRNGILLCAKFTLRPSLVLSYIGSITARHSSSGRQTKFAALHEQMAPPIFGRAAITLGIGPHSSLFYSSLFAIFVLHDFAR